MAQQLYCKWVDVGNLASVRLENQNSIFGRFKEPPVSSFGRLLALGNILHRKQNQPRTAILVDSAGIEQQGPPPGVFEFVLNLEVLETAASDEYVLQQPAQLRSIP